MPCFLISTLPAFGHVNPTLPIARELVERGHEVLWYTGEIFQSRIEATGARYIPMVAASDYSDGYPKHLIEKRKALPESAQGIFDLKHCLLDGAELKVKDYINILREFPVDVILCDSAFNGVSWVYEKGGPLWATLGVSVLFISSRDTAPFGSAMQPSSSGLGRLRNGILNWIFERVLMRDVMSYMNNARANVGLPRTQKDFFNPWESPFLHLQQTVPAFEYQRSDLPPQVHFIGPSLPSLPPDFTFPDWWENLKGNRPVIHVTQGTTNDNPEKLIVPTLQALKNEDMLVVATTNGQPVELAQYPKNAIIEEKYIPFTHLLPHIDVMVTNGGYNGVQVALAHGVPVVAAGTTEDKPEICARVEWSGVGVNLKTNNPTQKQIRDAVKKILASSCYKQKAKFFQAEVACYDAPTIAAALLEQLAATQKPVLITQQGSQKGL